MKRRSFLQMLGIAPVITPAMLPKQADGSIGSKIADALAKNAAETQWAAAASVVEEAPMMAPGAFVRVSGKCGVCGTHLGLYESKWIQKKTGEVRCMDHYSWPNESYPPDGFEYYTDG